MVIYLHSWIYQSHSILFGSCHTWRHILLCLYNFHCRRYSYTSTFWNVYEAGFVLKLYSRRHYLHWDGIRGCHRQCQCWCQFIYICFLWRNIYIRCTNRHGEIFSFYRAFQLFQQGKSQIRQFLINTHKTDFVLTKWLLSNIINMCIINSYYYVAFKYNHEHYSLIADLFISASGDESTGGYSGNCCLI